MIQLGNRQRKARASTALWLPVVVWMGLIFGLSSVPFQGSEPMFFRFQDKIIHILEFGALGILLARAVYFSDSGSRGRYWACILAAALYGGLDEFHQMFVPGRSVQWSDFAADSLGAVVCTWAWLKHKGESLFLRQKAGG